MAYDRLQGNIRKIISDQIKRNKGYPVTVVAGSVTIPEVIKVETSVSRQADGSDSYTDLFLKTKSGKEYAISLRGDSPPDLGSRGINAVIPNLTSKFLRKAHSELLGRGLKPGKQVPVIFGSLSKHNIEKLHTGTRATGGPVDYVYVGPRDVKYQFDETNDVISLNGSLYDLKSYAHTRPLYLTVHSEAGDARFDPEAMQGNAPKLYGSSPTMGARPIHVSVTDRVTNDGLLIRID